MSDVISLEQSSSGIHSLCPAVFHHNLSHIYTGRLRPGRQPSASSVQLSTEPFCTETVHMFEIRSRQRSTALFKFLQIVTRSLLMNKMNEKKNLRQNWTVLHRDKTSPVLSQFHNTENMTKKTMIPMLKLITNALQHCWIIKVLSCDFTDSQLNGLF